ncbi:nitroreductase/quinone reductase family protein [Pseudolysinimonas kribbensis]|uniref:nitroreductase/quinone reductase family protein n=1 Tax=Pseudolysinimonas kribbensis TaxID=433641 RepID=UPI0024E050D6|nr:nitroreductase/quinone reductase family protein [Pseudolysinimonas kribbensis]
MSAQDANTKVIEQFRAGGEVEGMHRDRLLLLTTTGRRSGAPRTTPMMRLHVRGTSYVVASANGAADDPAWLRDLEADPHAHVEEDEREYDATARVLRGSARSAAWSAIVEQAPFFAEHQDRVDREIPVVELINRSGV